MAKKVYKDKRINGVDFQVFYLILLKRMFKSIKRGRSKATTAVNNQLLDTYLLFASLVDVKCCFSMWGVIVN